MASINGIQIKSLKKFYGHEGEPLYQGNIYYKGKKLGFWSQDAHGAICDNFGFNEDILNAEVEKYVASDRVEDEYRSVSSIENLLADLVSLMDDEKYYKKYLKQCCPTTIVCTDGIDVSWIGTRKAGVTENVLKACEPVIADFKAKCHKNKKVKITLYRDLKDFDITV